MMINKVEKKTRLQVSENFRTQTYRDGELIYELMMDTLTDDYVSSLEDNIGRIVKSELADGKVCGELLKNIYRIEEEVQKWMGLDVEEGEIYTLTDSFYQLLNLTTINSYKVAFENLELDNWKGLDTQVIEMQRLHFKMVEAGINITKNFDAKKAEEIKKLLRMCETVILIFAQRARDYGAFFRQYEKLK